MEQLASCNLKCKEPLSLRVRLDPRSRCHGPRWHEFCGESWLKFEGASLRFGFCQWREEARGRSEVKEPRASRKCREPVSLEEPLPRPLVARVTAPHCTILHFTALFGRLSSEPASSNKLPPGCTLLHHTALYCTLLHHTALYCTSLHHTALYCTFRPAQT